MTIRELTALDFDAILPLYAAVGWTNYTENPEMLRRAYENSLLILGAFEADRLVGVLRAVGDGYSVVFIQDLLVLPEYQRQGIGTRLLRAVLDRYPDVYQTELMTDNTPQSLAFYRSIGFTSAEVMGCCGFLRMK